MAMKLELALLLVVGAIPSSAQFRMIEVTFSGIGCSSCVESMPARLQRLRGVESAVVDASKSIVTLRLASRNRVRLEQVRDFIEQDGTKTSSARVQVAGVVSEAGGKWMLDPPGLGTQYELDSGGAAIVAGTRTVWGETPSLHPESGPVVIRVRRLEASE
jgi:copper chaperone CopZ